MSRHRPAPFRVRIACSHCPKNPGHHATTFLIDETTAIDAGAIASRLSLTEQRAIRSVLLTHAHLDHVLELPQFLDDVQTDRPRGAPPRPVVIHAETATLDTLRRHLFGGLWPDVLDEKVGFASAAPFELSSGFEPGPGELTVTPFRTVHRVPAVGFRLDRDGRTLVIIADTGYKEGLLDFLRDVPQLAAVAIEVSYPDRLDTAARDHGHLTPALLARLLAGLGREDAPTPLWLHHVKPAFADEVLQQLRRLELPGFALRVLRDGDTFEL